MAVRMRMQVSLLCRGFWQFSRIVVFLAAGRQQAPAAVLKTFLFCLHCEAQTAKQINTYFGYRF
jgi:hypothetical protein